MGRWRPPMAKSSPYITAVGARSLAAELEQLWRHQRPQVVRALSAAAAEGDRSENAEYLYRKKQLAALDRRVRYLNRRLEEIQVVDTLPSARDVVRFGAWVDIIDEYDGMRRLRIVGADETDTARAWISVDSPVARALLGKRVGDEVTIDTPGGLSLQTIATITYELL